MTMQKDEKRRIIREVLKNKLGITHINDIELGNRLEFNTDYQTARLNASVSPRTFDKTTDHFNASPNVLYPCRGRQQ